MKRDAKIMNSVKHSCLPMNIKLFDAFCGHKNFLFQNIDDFVNNSMDVVMEVEKLNLDTTTGKVILCTPYHYGDLLAKECTNVIKKFVEEQLITNVSFNVLM